MGNRILVVACLPIILLSCRMQVPPPAISDISNADSLVRVQAQNMGDFWTPKWPPMEAILDEGGIGCSMFGKPAIMLSSRCMKTANPGGLFDWCVLKEFLFACRTEEEEAVRATVLPRARYVKDSGPKHESRSTKEPKQDESDAYKRCIEDVSGRVPSEWCDRFR